MLYQKQNMQPKKSKGFLQDGENWLELNATQHEISLKPIGAGQDVLIIIGEKLNEEKIRYYLE